MIRHMDNQEKPKAEEATDYTQPDIRPSNKHLNEINHDASLIYKALNDLNKSYQTTFSLEGIPDKMPSKLRALKTVYNKAGLSKNELEDFTTQFETLLPHIIDKKGNINFAKTKKILLETESNKFVNTIAKNLSRTLDPFLDLEKALPQKTELPAYEFKNAITLSHAFQMSTEHHEFKEQSEKREMTFIQLSAFIDTIKTIKNIIDADKTHITIKAKNNDEDDTAPSSDLNLA